MLSSEDASLQTDLGDFSVAIGSALDGGKKAIAEKHRLRDVVIYRGALVC